VNTRSREITQISVEKRRLEGGEAVGEKRSGAKSRSEGKKSVEKKEYDVRLHCPWHEKISRKGGTRRGNEKDLPYEGE